MSLKLSVEPPRRSAWVVALSYAHGWNHGAHLRTFAVTREWVRQGAEVHFIAARSRRDDAAAARAYLEQLRDGGIITGFDEVAPSHPFLRGKFARAALLPRARDVLLRPERHLAVRQLDAIARAVRPDVFVVTSRQLLYAVPHLQHVAPVVIDWIDSWTLASRRMMRVAVGQRRWLAAGAEAWRAAEQALEEGYYSRHAAQNVFVSPVDARTHLSHTRVPVTTIGNGIQPRSAAAAVEKIPGRLIFTGSMDFPPNHQAAVWFVRQVLPRILATGADVHFVVAGVNPLPELLALSSDRVTITGRVDDMRTEIAKSVLYVAPLISGSGFKNKVLEALAAGLNVVGTSLAFEFLPDRLRELFRAADDPAGLADAVVAALDDSAGNKRTVERFWEPAGDEFEWGRVAERFAAAVNHPNAA